MKKPSKTTVRGIVIPETWNDTGEVETLAIVTYTEKKYLVADNPTAKRLKKLLRYRVIAEGVVTESAEMNRIDVEHFQRDNTKPDLRAVRG